MMTSKRMEIFLMNFDFCLVSKACQGSTMLYLSSMLLSLCQDSIHILRYNQFDKLLLEELLRTSFVYLLLRFLVDIPFQVNLYHKLSFLYQTLSDETIQRRSVVKLHGYF